MAWQVLCSAAGALQGPHERTLREHEVKAGKELQVTSSRGDGQGCDVTGWRLLAKRGQSERGSALRREEQPTLS